MPPASRITDMHVCPMVTGVVPHVGGPIMKGEPTVITGKMPQARVTDILTCVGPPDVIAKGSAGVFAGKLPCARIGDLTAHGGTIILGFPTVIIGETGGGGGGGAGASSGGPASGGDSAGQILLAYTDFVTQVQTLVAAANSGAPFCEACFQAAQARLANATA